MKVSRLHADGPSPPPRRVEGEDEEAAALALSSGERVPLAKPGLGRGQGALGRGMLLGPDPKDGPWQSRPRGPGGGAQQSQH